VQSKRLLGPIVAYTLYAFVVFSVMLYVTFPYQLVQERLSEPLLQHGLRLTVAALRPDFPLGLSSREVRLHLEAVDANTPTLQMQALRVRPDWRDLLSGKLQARFEAMLYNGRVDGTLRYTAGDKSWAIDTQMVNIDLAQYPLLRKQNKMLFTGKLNGTASMVLQSAGQLRDGVINWQVQPLVFTGRQELQLPLQQDITCDTLKLELKLITGKPGDRVLNCLGNDLTIEAFGTVGWQSPLTASEVNLLWKIHSDTTYKQEMTLLGSLIRRPADRRGDLTFRMQGPLRQLRYGA
jgi:type II secretion system protein N